jgi:hypothetical protein
MTAIATAAPTLDDFYTDPYPGRKGSERIRFECSRCSGSGEYYGPNPYTGWVAAQGRNGAPCFGCMGRGFSAPLVSSLRATARRHAKAALQSALDAIEAQGARAAFTAEHGDLVEALKAHRERSSFLAELADRVEYGTGTLTDRQIEAARATIARIAEEEAAKRPVVEGRHEVEGEVLKVAEHWSAFGGRDVCTLKVTVKVDGGYLLWGSLPSGLGAVERGDRIAFTATVEKSDRDESFGFFKRPTKARRLG